MAEIVRTPGTCGGRARIAGTRIAVWLLLAQWRSDILDFEILECYPHLNQGQLDAARAYLETHREEVEQDLADQEGD